MHQWMSSGSVFCMLCGKVNQNPSTLIRHISSEHNICCAQCRVAFASKDQLSAHLLQHERKTCSKGEEHHSKNVKSQVDSGFNLNLEPHSISLQSNCSKSLYPYKKDCIRKPQAKYMFQCDTCSTVFSRRFDLKRHKIMYHSEKHSDKENSGDKSVNRVEEKNETIMCTNESLDNFVGSIRSDVEDVNVMNFSDDSVNSEDISRHLDISTYSTSQVSCKVANENQGFTCSLCGFACPKRQEMLSHRRKEHSLKEQKVSVQKSASSKIFSCSLCQNSYSRSSDLQRHILKKHGGEKFVGRCVDSVDDMSVEVINQAKQDINGTIVYQCDICEKNMLTKRGFVRHVRIHRDERPFTCHVCGRQYRSHPDLTRHLRSVHDKVKNYPCDICGRSFANKGTRDDHRRTHTGERPYVCHTCGKAFPTPNSIYVHRRTHSDYFPHHCTTCSKKFRRRQQLTHHMRTHTGEKPHSCDVCGKCFGVKDEVTRHRQTHSNEKPHICPVCGICFGQKRYLTNHMKTHHSRVMCNILEEECNDDSSRVFGKDSKDGLMSDYESEEEFKTLYSCSICGTSDMDLETFLQHTKKNHTKKERSALMEKLVSDISWTKEEAKSAAAVFGFKLQPSVESSVPLYVCVVCGQGNLVLRSLNEHSSLHPEYMESHYCNLCQQHFQEETELAVHLETHLDRNDLVCEYCNKRYSIIDDLELHESSHHRAEFVCVECYQKFTSQYFVLTHLKESHCRGLVCRICSIEFESDSLLDTHIITHAIADSVKSVVKIFLCEVCGKKYDSKVALQRHNLFLHNKRMPLLCELCGFPTYHQDSVREHLIKEHSDVTFMCSECDVLFFEKFKYDTHMATHTQKKIFNCRYCGSRFRKLDNLKFHLKLHGRKGTRSSYFVEELSDLESEEFLHGFEMRLFTCDKCGQSFNEQDLYSNHIKSHDAIVCNLCGISFNGDSDLNDHLHRVHPSKFSKLDSKIGGLPFKCDVCSASFRLEFELDQHSKNHIFYQCHLCFEEFVHDIHLQSHLENSHNGGTCKNQT